MLLALASITSGPGCNTRACFGKPVKSGMLYTYPWCPNSACSTWPICPRLYVCVSYPVPASFLLLPGILLSSWNPIHDQSILKQYEKKKNPASMTPKPLGHQNQLECLLKNRFLSSQTSWLSRSGVDLGIFLISPQRILKLLLWGPHLKNHCSNL